MTSISSLLSSSSSSYSSSGITGLVTGMDTDSLIDSMTIGTRTKIAKQKQSQTLLSWKTDAYRTISDKLVSFADKYSSYSSSTNLNSASFYSKSVISATGANSKYVSVSGKATTGQEISVEGVKQLAKVASFSSSAALSSNTIETDAIEFDTATTCTLTGKSFTVEYGSDTYVVTMPQKEGGGVYSNAAEVAQGLTAAFEDVALDNGKKLSEVLSVTANGETLNLKNIDVAGNKLSIVSGSSDFMNAIGLSSSTDSVIDKSITSTGLNGVAAIDPADLQVEASFSTRMLNKSLIFEYNGEKQTITFDDETKLSKDNFKEYLQGKLDSAFGKGRIEVSLDGEKNKLSFETVLPSETGLPPNPTDGSSVLTITTSSTGLMGAGSVFGINSGATNKLNLDSALEDSGLKGVKNVGLVDGTEYEIRINGKSIKITYEEGKTSLDDIITAINADEDADVSMTYQENSDAFSITSTQNGASGSVVIGATGGTLNDFERLLFGTRDTDGNIIAGSDALNGTTTKGQDAIILVDFDGDGGADPMKITRGTNSFTLDGMKIVVNGTFGYEKDSEGELKYVEGTEAVTFSATTNTDKMVEVIKGMIEAYNTVVETSNTSVQEKRDRDYQPLTDEQKEEMSEDEITSWEKKAKAGMLFNDSDISSLTSDLRYAFLNVKSGNFSLEDIGITVSSDWEDNGKIVLDESALKAAIEEDSDSVKELFTAESTTGKSLTTGGIMTRLKTIMDKYAKTTGATKGILIEKAGNAKSPSSLLKNSLLTQMNDIDDVIETLEDRLETERTRYQTKFTALEQLTQQMNSQSSWLSDLASS
ncbi:MAG: flagellar filament capping protein FliD [Anaerotignum sp.]|nr:flagellar filament capping protein FliD [Anaerotignum sp.]